MPKLRVKRPVQQAAALLSSKTREHRDHPADGPSLAYECEVCHHRAATKHGLRCHFDNICFPARRRSHPLILSRSTMVTAKQIALLNCDMPFRFMDLPPEIRLRVYGYLFVPRGPIQIKEVEAIVNGVLDKRILGLYKEGRAAQVRCFETESASNILTVSKTIHYEAIEILHRGVTFVFGSETDLIDHFLAKIGPAQQSHLTQIRLAYGFYGYRFLSSMRQLLESATRLAGFILDFESSNLRHLLGYYDAFEAFPRCSLEFRESPVSDPPGSTIPGLYEFVRLCFGKSGEGHNSPEHLQVLGLAGEQGQNSFAPVNLVRSSEQLRQWQNDQECATFMASDLDKALRELLERYKRSKNIF